MDTTTSPTHICFQQSATAALEEASAAVDKARREREELDVQLQRARQRLEDANAANAARRTELRGLEDQVAAAAAGAEAQRARLESEAETYRKEEATLRAEVERVRAERAEAEARRASLRDEAKRAREEKVGALPRAFSAQWDIGVTNVCCSGRCREGCTGAVVGDRASSPSALGTRWARDGTG